MRVFWPQNCLGKIVCGNASDALLVGWKNPDAVVVVTALPFLEIKLAEQLLIHDRLVAQPRSSARSSAQNAAQLYARFNNQRLEVIGTYKSHFSEIRGNGITVYKGKTAVDSCGESCLLIYFNPPSPARMQFFTLSPSNLHRTWHKRHNLSAELGFHFGAPSEVCNDSWELIVAQLNCVHDLQPVLRRNAGALFRDLAKDPNLITQIVKRLRRGSLMAIAQPRVRPAVTSLAITVILCVRRIVERILVLLETASLIGRSVLSLFCTAQQVHLRFHQLCCLPLEYIVIQRKSQHAWHWLRADRNDAYIRFNNHLWLTVNDWLLGFYFYTVLCAYENTLGTALTYWFNEILVNQFARAASWLTAWPAGFKLNSQLGYFIGEITIWIIYAWKSIGSHVFNENTSRLIVRLVAFAGVIGGATLQISLAIDLLSIACLHLQALNQSLARVYSQQLNVLASLFRLFRGRKYNRLRARVDAGDYDMHQLLLGTILFMVSLFLLPTVAAFYTVFALAHLSIYLVVAVLCVALAFLNYFPLFPLLLRIKAPNRLPSGVYFTRGKVGCTLQLHSKAMLWSEIFEQYTDTLQRFVAVSFNWDAVVGVLSGRVLQLQQATLYASLYSVLPRHRGSVEKLRTDIENYGGEPE